MSWQAADGRAHERVLGRRRGLVVHPVREQDLARVGAAPERIGGREVVEQRRRPTVAERLVALRFERHDQADRRRDRARVERHAAEFLVEHDRRRGRGQGAHEPELEDADVVTGQVAEAAVRQLRPEAVAMVDGQPGDDAAGSGQRAQAPAPVGGGRRHGRTSGKRGSGAIDGHRVRTQARSGSSVLAIVRRSPARAFR